jgi:ceramide glucosyltransferase
VILEIACAIAAGYQIFAIIACLRFRSGKPAPVARSHPPVSILKPVRGLNAGFREAIASHCRLGGEYDVLEGEYELLCGVRSLDDPAVAVLREFPRVRVIECRTDAPNQKVGVLIDLAREARHPILVVNDSDIRVEPDYLSRVTGPLEDASVGLVTCLYRPIGSTFAARFEGLGVSTEFAPSTLVARMVGVEEFAMGSTLAFRRADLKRMGGFQAISEYLADDYQLGARLHGLGLKCVLSDVIVATHLEGTLAGVWSHQVRWARTIRVSNFAGYLGLPVTFATFWSLLAALEGRWAIALAVLAVRLLMAFESGWMVMRSRDVLRWWFLIPLRDLFGAAVWAAALFGNSVIWRGQKLRLDRRGRIQKNGVPK